MLDVFPPPCPLIQGNPAVITEHDEIRLISRNSIHQICFSTCWIHPVGAFSNSQSQKNILYNSFVVFSPEQNNHVNIVLNGMFNSFLGYQTKQHPRFFFFFGAKNTHHVAATSWCTLPKCLARALSLPGGKFFFPASMKPGSHRRVSPC